MVLGCKQLHRKVIPIDGLWLCHVVRVLDSVGHLRGVGNMKAANFVTLLSQLLGPASQTHEDFCSAIADLKEGIWGGVHV